MKSKLPKSGPGAPATERFAAVSGAAEAELPATLKGAAAVLLNRPVYYTIGRPGRQATLRLSVALSLSIGPPLTQRYVITMPRGAARPTIDEDGELTIAADAASELLTTLPKSMEADLAVLASGVREACEVFQSRREVTEALNVIGRKRREELVGIGQLYATRRGAQQRLWGFAEPGAQGSTAVEAEMRRLQRTVLERYAVLVRVRILSLGVIAEVGAID